MANQPLPDSEVRQIYGQSVHGSVVPGGNFFSADGTLLQLPDGFTEHGKTLPDSTFLAEKTVDGQQLWGSYGDDGSFLSQDQKTYVPAGSDKPETGITDPVTGQFLPNGEVRQIDGQSVYGSVGPDRTFYSADGTLLQLPDGFTEHGKTLPDSTFLAEKTVDGQQLWGSYGDDGSFLSQDQKTYVPAGSDKPETGITTPDGSFLPGGATRTLSDGTLYGYNDNGGFYSADGKTLVLPDNTVVAGTLNQNTGIFIGNNGSDYFVGQNGIVPVTPQPDGSFKEPDGSVIMTAQSWHADLAQFQEAMKAVGSEANQVASYYEQIQSYYPTLASVWVSPAGTSFEDFRPTIDSAMGKLNSVLASIGQAMHQNYNNYLQAEQANTSNFTSS